MFSLQLKWFSRRGAAAPARSFETDGIKEARLNQPQSALMGGGVARDDWVSAGNETAPLPAVSTATQKTNIASCVTNEPALTSSSDL